ncbi:MAG: ATP-dependent Clp protease proteolytic subunit [Halobacteriota archaeon]|nr:ATP-dependent Clp protease proteolytic subunit [Halobacteriota archaeon]
MIDSTLKLKLFEYLGEHLVDIVNRRIYLVGDIELGVVETVVQHIHYLNSSLHVDNFNDPITLLVNSVGGHDDMMLYLYDAITLSDAEIVTIGSGTCCSAAALILVSGDRRYCTSNAMFMTHKGKIQLEGDDDEIQAQAEITKKISERYWKLIGRHTNKSAQWWYDKSKGGGELWLDADEMVKYGVVDAIISPSRRQLVSLSPRKLQTRTVSEDDDY